MDDFSIGQMVAAVVAGNIVSAAFLASFIHVWKNEKRHYSGLTYAGLLLPLAVVILGLIAAG